MEETGAASAIEFALVAGPMLLATVFCMVISLIVYQGLVLDFAVSKAARQIMTGQVQIAGIGQAAFRTQVLCPYLSASMNCSNVVVSVQTVTEATQPGGYYALVNSSATALLLPTLTVDTAPYAPGASGSYEYLLVIYPVTYLPSFIMRLLGTATFKGAPAYPLISTAAFKNERYSQ